MPQQQVPLACAVNHTKFVGVERGRKGGSVVYIWIAKKTNFSYNFDIYGS